MEWLSNHWAVGAVAGLVSGLVVMLVVRQLYAARDQREYHESLAAANSEILHAIRPAIAQKVIPSNAMLDALFSATARKHGVDGRDLLPKAGFANELMKEVIDNGFLTSQQKVEFCELVAGMKQPGPDAASRRGAEVVTVITRAESADPSLVLGLATGLTAFMATTFLYATEKEAFLATGPLMKILPVLAIVIIIPVMAYLLLDLVRQTLRPRREFEVQRIAAPGAVTPLPAHQDLPEADSAPLRAAPQGARP